MPYKHIVFVQVEKRLLNDHRWWGMTSYSQLIYIKLLLLAAETMNKLPEDMNVLRLAIRSDLPLKDFKKCFEEIRTNFPKLRKHRNFYYIHEFHKYTNYIPKGKSQGNPEEIQRNSYIDIDIDIDKDKKQKLVDNSTSSKAKINGLVKNLAETMLSPAYNYPQGRRK